LKVRRDVGLRNQNSLRGSAHLVKEFLGELVSFGKRPISQTFAADPPSWRSFRSSLKPRRDELAWQALRKRSLAAALKL